MVWLVDDLAEAALGPWGLAVGLGVGGILLLRRRIGLPEEAAGSNDPSILVRAQMLLSHVGDWWSDLYAEAHAEWAASRPAPEAAAASTLALSPASRARASAPTKRAPASTSTRRVRGPDGRYVKQSN